MGGPQGGAPTMKFNMGSGNNFIVKNSNIVITSNPNAGHPMASQNPTGVLSPAQQQQAMVMAQA